jgi:4-amino-4-deoxy-L-arabinose transferase-like glycosyltransferase
MWEKAKNFILSHEAASAAILLLLGCILRLAFIGAVPVGLNQDEASAGYDAWAILNYGIDRCGNRLPVLLESWGSGQNVLYSLICIPFIALLGLSEFSLRLPMALFGCVTLFVFWRLARRQRGRLFGLTALFALAVCPWHIMASRWALESNLLPGMLLLGIYLIEVSRRHEWALVGAAAVLSLSLYAYGTAFFFLPPFLIYAVVHLRHDLRARSFFCALAVFVIIALPITLCQLINALGASEFTLFGLTITKLTESRQSATSVFGGGGLSAVGENIRALGKILLTGSDGLVYNALDGWGLFYPVGLPLAIIGFASSAALRRDYKREGLLRAALVISLAAGCLISVNINRINMLWLPMAYFASVGMYIILRAIKQWSALVIAAGLVCLCLFVNSYKQEFYDSPSAYYFPGLGSAIEYAEAQEPESVFISTDVNAPYIFALFYTETPPQEFIDSVSYINPNGAFRAVSSFGHFTFGDAENAQGEYLILPYWKVGEHEVLAQFGYYCVCK